MKPSKFLPLKVNVSSWVSQFQRVFLYLIYLINDLSMQTPRSCGPCVVGAKYMINKIRKTDLFAKVRGKSGIVNINSAKL